MRPREIHISDLAAHILRLEALSKLAEVDESYIDHDRQRLAKQLRDARHEIVDLLRTDEIADLAKRGLRPEQAGDVIRTEPSVPMSKLEKSMIRQRTEAQLARPIFTVSKTFDTAEVEQRDMASMIKAGHAEQRTIMPHRKVPAQDVESAALDAELRHRRLY